MKLYRSIADRARAENGGCVLTIGAYDGLHLGHQAIFARLKEEADNRSCPAVVMSFEPTPGEYLAGDIPPARLTRFRERYLTLAKLGIDELFCPRFSNAMRSMNPEQFVNDVLVDTLGARHIVVGSDFRFAAKGEGTVDTLRAAGSQFGFEVSEVPAIRMGSERISSTAIRQALATGDMARARQMLGRNYSMCGNVVYGNQLGRTLGFPTANVPVLRIRSPVQGIFAVRVRGLGEGPLDGVSNVGTRPTVAGGGKTILETFIFDFDRDIYGECIEVEFIARLRDELRFPDLESMTVQMHRDVENALEALAKDS